MILVLWIAVAVTLKAFHSYITNFSLKKWIFLINILVFYPKNKTKTTPDPPTPSGTALLFCSLSQENCMAAYICCLNIFNSLLSLTLKCSVYFHQCIHVQSLKCPPSFTRLTKKLEVLCSLIPQFPLSTTFTPWTVSAGG